MTRIPRLALDTADFDSLVADARALIPQLAPSWSDQNVHDPGIMLLELAAWAADQEIFALARERRDERQAYAAALGIRPRGPWPAEGLLWPILDPGDPVAPWPNGTPLAQGDMVSVQSRETPDFTLRAAVTLTSARITGISVEPVAAGAQAYPARLPPAGVEPFGAGAAAGARLRIILEGDLLPPGWDGRAVLSLGVETDSPAIQDSRARISASWSAGGGRVALPILKDETHALGQTGVVLIDISGLAARPPTGGGSLALTLAAALRPLPARVTRLALNVLPVRQETDGDVEVIGTGLPDQVVALPDGVLFGAHAAPPRVVRLTGGADEVWTAADLSSAGPDDRVFAFDPAANLVRFGNGLNGAAPALNAAMRVTCKLTAGGQGLVPAGSTWKAAGAEGLFSNPQSTHGGADADDLEELRRATRGRLAAMRPIVTDDDLRDAALAAQDLQVRRAEVLPGYRPGDCARLAGAARTLVVLGPDAGQPGSESAPWLDILRRRIRPRLTLGDRVAIVRPAYVPVRLQAKLTPRSGVSPAQLRTALDDALSARARLVPIAVGDAVWPLGLDLNALEVAGWLRRVPGVAAVADATVAIVGGAFGATVPIPRHGLPVLVRTPGDISIGNAA